MFKTINRKYRDIDQSILRLNKGFTLLEILLVTTIIGILAAIVLVEKSRNKRTTLEFGGFRNRMEEI
jgi:prepilin-type N-terminal cleavage/methylation domain-containing protein